MAEVYRSTAQTAGLPETLATVLKWRDASVPLSEEDFTTAIEELGNVVEILSTNRRDDLVGKVQRCSAWRSPSYWIVDPRDHQVLTMELVEGVHLETGRVIGGQVTLRYGDVEVPVDIDALLA